MEKLRHSIQKKLISSNDARIPAITCHLKTFFNDSNTQSPVILKTILEEHYPSTSIYEIIISLYSNSLYKPILSKLIDQTVEYLYLNNNENNYQINEQIKNSKLLHNAISKEHEHILRFLLQSGFNPNSLLSDHKTPLSIAVVNNKISPTKRLEIIQLLIRYGANAVIPDNTNVSPFKRLCGMG